VLALRFSTKGIRALEPTKKLRVAFVTHLHPDHTVGYPDMMYGFDTSDTNPVRETIDACPGCDVLIHEANTPGGCRRDLKRFKSFLASITGRSQLAELARQAKPRLLILYHYSGLLR
jgi:ribonuclease BN (tRNA processing enzyme)